MPNQRAPFLKKNYCHCIQILTLFLVRELTDEESSVLIARIEGFDKMLTFQDKNCIIC